MPDDTRQPAGVALDLVGMRSGDPPWGWGVQHSAAIWHIPEALVAWGVTGDTSPLLKAVPPSKNQARAGSWVFVPQPLAGQARLWKSPTTPSTQDEYSCRGAEAAWPGLSGPAGLSHPLHLAQVPQGMSQGRLCTHHWSASRVGPRSHQEL